MNQTPSFQASPELLTALSLAPFVAVAWAEAGLDLNDEERALVLSWAAEMGLTKADAGHELLEYWLAERPGPQFLATWKSNYVCALSRSLAHEAKEELKRYVMRRARTLVRATGAFRGAGRTPSVREQAVMDEIESALS